MGGSTTPQKQSTISAFFKPVASPSSNNVTSSESPNKENHGQLSLSSSSNSSSKKKASVTSTPTKQARHTANRPSKKRARSPASDAEDDVADETELALLPDEKEFVPVGEPEKLTLTRRSRASRAPKPSPSASKDTETADASTPLQFPLTSSSSSSATLPKGSSSSSVLSEKFAFKKGSVALEDKPDRGPADPNDAPATTAEEGEDALAPSETRAAPVEMDEEKAARRARFLDKLGNFRSSAAIPPKEQQQQQEERAQADEDDDEADEVADGDSSFVMADTGSKRRRIILSESEDDNDDDYAEKGQSEEEEEDAAMGKKKKVLGGMGGSKKKAPSTTTAHMPSSASSAKTSLGGGGQDAWKAAFSSGGGASGSRGKKEKSPFTPLEKQFIEIKQQYPDAILCIEVGYKFKFFGEDAQIASKELSIAHFMDHNFYTASIPVHRLDVHVRRLVHAGYKVGVVRQTETAALKSVGDNKSAPFTRKLSNLYTKATFLESLEEPLGGGASASSSHYLACIVEELQGGMGADERVRCAILAVQPATGDIVYDEFQDTYMRSELETRLLHIQPAELILPEKGLSPATEKLVRHLSMPSSSSSQLSGMRIGKSGRANEVRTERSEAFFKYNKAFSLVSEFYSNNLKEAQQQQQQHQQSKQEEQENKGQGSKATDNMEGRLAGLMTTVLGLPQNVIVGLWAMIEHLKAFGLAHVFVQTKYFQPFHTVSHMLLNGNTLNNLEIFRNQTDGGVKGSLLEILDQTRTGFGRRLLKKWVGKPLVDRRVLQQRVDAVEEILAKQQGSARDAQVPNEALGKVDKCLTGLMDLEKGVCRIHYGYASPKEFLLVLKTFERIMQLFPEQVQANEADKRRPSSRFGLESPYLNELLVSLSVASDTVPYFLNALDEQAARQNDKIRLLDRTVAATKWPEILEHEAEIQATEEQLRLHLKDIQKLLREPRLEFVTVAGIDYLVEVKNKDTAKVPKSWVKISGTKQVSRFHTPETTKLIHARAQHQERLTLRCNDAFKEFCKEFSGQYEVFRDVVQALATLDCLFSLAAVARRPGYCKAEYVDSEDEDEEEEEEDDKQDEEKAETEADQEKKQPKQSRTLGQGGSRAIGGRRGQRGRGASTVIEIQKGRHPMVEQLLQGGAGTDFVPNDVDFGKRTTTMPRQRRRGSKKEEQEEEEEQDDKWTTDEQKTMILTGPNMGGKSCYIRQVALLCLMAQIGSYVPAERARLSLLDAIYTRMGASDNLFGNESTFMVELQETSTILRMATPKSLIILDELGRGTSTLDGVAIAYAVLKYCVTEIRATTLFVTHYPSLAEVASEFPKGRVRNYHMGFMATKVVAPTPALPSTKAVEGQQDHALAASTTTTWIDSTKNGQEVSEHDEIVFLYNLVEGVSLKSYGLNVARLAKLPPSLIARAKEKSKELEMLLEQRRQRRRQTCQESRNVSPRGTKRPREDDHEVEQGTATLGDPSTRQQQSIELLRRIWTCQTPEQAQQVFDLCR